MIYNIYNTRKRLRVNIYRLVALLLMTSLLFVVPGCSKKEAEIVPGSSILTPPKKPVTEAPTNESNEIVIKGVFTKIDTASMKMNFLDINEYVEYEVPYHGGTDIKTKYATIIAASNMSLGEVYDVTCDESGSAKTIYGCKDVWEKKNINGFDISQTDKTITIGASVMNYSSNTVVLSDGEKIPMSQVVSQDEVTIRGIGGNICSVVVEKSHGYLKLTGVDAFVNGYISIGKQQLLKVTSGMLITAQEGTHMIELHNGSLRAEKQIVISKNEESVLDFSEYAAPAKPKGVVNFKVTPSDAIMVLDGVETTYNGPVQLSYGKHTVVFKASKYETYTEVFTVNSSYETKIIDMVASGSTATSTSADDKTKGYSVNVTTPEGATLYVDGAYVGTVPCKFDKKAGNCIVTLSKTGFETVSYTISITNTNGDVSYAFPDLVKKE